MLRRAGMWTPAGTRLLTAHTGARIASGPSGLENAVLSVAVPEDSDGVLSLQIRWNREWARRRGEDGDSMAPGWTLIRRKRTFHVNDTALDMHIGSAENHEKVPFTEATTSASKADSVTDAKDADQDGDLLEIQMTPWGITAARCRSSKKIMRIDAKEATSIDVSHLDDDSITVSSASTSSITPNLWISAAATALNGTQPTVEPSPLWPHTIHPIISHLSGKPCIPVGVLVILDLLPAASAPAWELSIEPDQSLAWQRRSNKMLEDLEEDRAISKLPADQQVAARQAKQTRRARAFHTEHLQEQEERRQREERRVREALNSTKWASKAVAQTCASWLSGDIQQQHAVLSTGSGPREAVEKALWDSIVRYTSTSEKSNTNLAIRIAEVLQLWRGWADSGGITREDLDKIADAKEVFAYAACVLALVGSFSGSAAEKTSEDVRECVVNWPIVRIG